MPRAVSQRFRTAVLAPQTNELILVLLVIRHPTLSVPLRFVNNMQNCSSSVAGDGQQTYLACPFDVILPEERSDQLPTCRISVINVDENIVKAVRSINTPPTLEVYVVLGSTPNVLEAGPWRFTMRNVTYDASTVEGTLSFPDTLGEPFPGYTFSPNRWPGVFGPGYTPPGFPNTQQQPLALPAPVNQATG
jgi:hypothetical protein